MVERAEEDLEVEDEHSFLPSLAREIFHMASFSEQQLCACTYQSMLCLVFARQPEKPEILLYLLVLDLSKSQQ